MTAPFTGKNKRLAHGALAHCTLTASPCVLACVRESIVFPFSTISLTSTRLGNGKCDAFCQFVDIDGNWINPNASHGFRLPHCRSLSYTLYFTSAKRNQMKFHFASKRTLFLRSFTSFIILISFCEQCPQKKKWRMVGSAWRIDLLTASQAQQLFVRD